MAHTKRELMTIGEFAERAGVTTSTLRFYERRQLVSSERTPGNQRRYRRAELRRVAFIRTAQSVGLSLEDIAEALNELPERRIPTKADWERLSSNWRDRLTQRIKLLQRLRDDLTGCIGCGCLSLKGCSLYNRDDELASQGPGARILIDEDPLLNLLRFSYPFESIGEAERSSSVMLSRYGNPLPQARNRRFNESFWERYDR